MANGVSEVQDLAQSCFAFVLLNNVFFHAKRPLDDGFQVRFERCVYGIRAAGGIACVWVRDVVRSTVKRVRRSCIRARTCVGGKAARGSRFLEQPEQLRVGGQRHFHGFRKPVRNLTTWQRMQHIQVNEHFSRLIERADHIFVSTQVNGGFSANGAIDLRKHRGGDVVEINAAHVACGNESRKIAHNAATHGNHAVAARELRFNHGLQQPAEYFQALALLALRHNRQVRFGALISHGVSVLQRHAAIGNNQHFAVKIAQRARLCQAAALNYNVVGALAQTNVENHSLSSRGTSML